MNEVTTQKPQSPLAEFKGTLRKMIESNDLGLPSNVKPEAFRNAAIVTVQDNPGILRCSPETVFKSIRRLAAAGLVPDGNEAALVPFKSDCTAIPMVAGLIKMARRSGDVRDIRAHTVYQREVDEGRFEYVIGDEERLDHKPILFGEKGDAVGYYAIAKLKDGTIVRTFMDRIEVERIRKGAASQRGNAKPQGIWEKHYDQMAQKTVIRRLVKRLDLSAEDMRHIAMDDDQQSPRDITPPEPEKDRKTLAQRLAEEEAPAEPIDGEILEPQDQDPIKNADPDHNTLEYAEGRTAGGKGTPLTECPYEQGTEEWMNWAAGHAAGKAEDE
jgi:recombination protein RecT